MNEDPITPQVINIRSLRTRIGSVDPWPDIATVSFVEAIIPVGALHIPPLI